MEEIIVKIDGREHKVNVEEYSNGKLKVHLNGKIFEVETKTPSIDILDEELSSELSKEDKKIIKAPLPGTVVAINVKEGDTVKEGDSLLKLVAMKMENDIIAESDGIIGEVKVKKNDSVNKDDVMVVLK